MGMWIFFYHCKGSLSAVLRVVHICKGVFMLAYTEVVETYFDIGSFDNFSVLLGVLQMYAFASEIHLFFHVVMKIWRGVPL